MKKDKWIWMPHAGHFIMGNSCRFRLNTYVGKYIVSTVGELFTDQQVKRIHAEIQDPKWYAENRLEKGDVFDYKYQMKFGYDDLGSDRTYETMVFVARKSKEKCCPWEIDVSEEVDMNGYNKAEDAYAGHLKLCKKWSFK
jgi:hypothetical protein